MQFFIKYKKLHHSLDIGWCCNWNFYLQLSMEQATFVYHSRILPWWLPSTVTRSKPDACLLEHTQLETAVAAAAAAAIDDWDWTDPSLMDHHRQQNTVSKIFLANRFTLVWLSHRRLYEYGMESSYWKITSLGQKNSNAWLRLNRSFFDGSSSTTKHSLESFLSQSF